MLAAFEPAGLLKVVKGRGGELRVCACAVDGADASLLVAEQKSRVDTDMGGLKGNMAGMGSRVLDWGGVFSSVGVVCLVGVILSALMS